MDAGETVSRDEVLAALGQPSAAAIAERVADHVTWGARRDTRDWRVIRDRAESAVQAILQMGGTVTLPDRPENRTRMTETEA